MLILLPNGYIASGSADTNIMIWDLTKTYPLYTLRDHTDVVRALTVINNQYLASGAQDMTIKLWDLSSYSLLKSWTVGTSWVLSLAFDSTLNVLASGDNANMVKVWSSTLWTNISTTSKN